MKLFHSKSYKVLSSYIYGWGACCVIIGALFKIMHFPYAGLILTVGMIVEAFIFFISVFEPQMEHYDWARVFPQLGKDNLDSANKPAMSTQTQSGQVHAVGLEPRDADDLKRGIRKIVETADSLATVGAQAPVMAQKLDQISNSFERLNNNTRMVGDALENSAKELTGGCSEINRLMTDSARELSDKFKMNCEEMMKNMVRTGEQYSALGHVMEGHSQQMKSGLQALMHENIRVNENIAALNALYEIQVRDTQEGLEEFRKLNGEAGRVLQHVTESSKNTFRFKEETQQLADKLSSLNSVYGNMLSLINNN